LCCSIFGPAVMWLRAKTPLDKKAIYGWSSPFLFENTEMQSRFYSGFFTVQHPPIGPTETLQLGIDTHPFGVNISWFPRHFPGRNRQVQASLAQACSLRRWYRFISGLIEKLGNIRGFP
jgi:hypothetical protein